MKFKYIAWFITICLLILKIAEVSPISWWIVFVPLIIYYSVWVLFFLFLIVIGVIWSILYKKEKKKK